nr:hypothetical protein CFP56_28653 [Quercus suber]
MAEILSAPLPSPTVATNTAISEELNPTPKAKKKKRKRASKPPVQTQFTIRNAPWTYIQLEHFHFGVRLSSKPANSQLTATATSSLKAPLDPPTAHLHLQAALSRFLGLHGSAIAYEILRLEDARLWIRVPAEEAKFVRRLRNGDLEVIGKVDMNPR